MTLSASVNRSKVDRYLSSLEQGFGSLAAVSARRDAMEQVGPETDDQLADRLASQDEWWDHLDRLETLCAAYDVAEMTADQISRFASLCVTVLEQLPLIARLGLRSPAAPTVDAVRGIAQRSIMAKGA
jgi:hypothetical protein